MAYTHTSARKELLKIHNTVLAKDIINTSRLMPLYTILYLLKYSHKRLHFQAKQKGFNAQESIKHEKVISNMIKKLKTDTINQDDFKEINKYMLLAIKEYVDLFYLLEPNDKSKYFLTTSKLYTLSPEYNLLLLPIIMQDKKIDRDTIEKYLFSSICKIPIDVIAHSCKEIVDIELLKAQLGINDMPEEELMQLKKNLKILSKADKVSLNAYSTASEAIDDFISSILTFSNGYTPKVLEYLSYKLPTQYNINMSLNKMLRERVKS
ncbi:MAG: hypothetical protein ACP5LP_01425 [Candidatus Micrarchaeia archaeon]